MGDYTAPPAPATCESVAADVTADASADVPVAYGRELAADICLSVDLAADVTDARDKLVALDADASLE